MIPKTINLGPLIIHLYGAIIAIAIFLGWYLAKKRAHLFKQSLRSSPAMRDAGLKISQAIFEDPILLIPLTLAIIGARAYHVTDYWHLYKENLISILYIYNGGLGIWGALFGAILGFWLVAKIKKLDFLNALDLVAPSLLLGQAIGRVGNYVNQEGFGPPSTAPWSVYIDPANRPPQYQNFSRFHPTFFYEAILDLIFFLILIAVAKRLKKGQAFALYLVLYSTSRFIVEFWRIDTWVVGQIKISHLLSIVVLTGGVYLFYKLSKFNKIF